MRACFSNNNLHSLAYIMSGGPLTLGLEISMLYACVSLMISSETSKLAGTIL